MTMQNYLAAGSAVVCALSVLLCAQDWSESTLYITRTGPPQPAVQRDEPLLSARAPVPADQQAMPAAPAPESPAPRALQSGIVRTAPAATRTAAAAATDSPARTPAAASAAVDTPPARATAILRRRPASPPPSAAATAVTVDKFVDHNNDGYDDRSQADDL